MEPTVQCLAAQFKACLLEAQALSTPKEPLAVLA